VNDGHPTDQFDAIRAIEQQITLFESEGFVGWLIKIDETADSGNEPLRLPGSSF